MDQPPTEPTEPTEPTKPSTNSVRSLWVDRLLERRSDITFSDYNGKTALVRRDELLVALQDLPDVQRRADGWLDGVEVDEEAGVARCRLTPGRGTRPAELAEEFATGTADRKLAVTPNHIMSGAPGAWGGGPADSPIPPTSPPRLPVVSQRTSRPFTVAVLDTGVSSHPWFDNTAWFGDVRPEDLELLDELPHDLVLDAQAGHGTFIIGVILQSAPSVYVTASKLLASDGVCDELSVVRKLRQLKRWSDATGRHLDVVNLSFGGYTVDDQPSPHVADAIAALGRDTVVVACAGNEDASREFWPAAMESVIAVGALDSDGSARAPFSNYGMWVNACAIGERVSSSFVSFDGPILPTGDFDDDHYEQYATWSGTSFSAPRVVGAIAALALERGISASAAADIVLDPATAQSMPGLGVVVPAA